MSKKTHHYLRAVAIFVFAIVLVKAVLYLQSHPDVRSTAVFINIGLVIVSVCAVGCYKIATKFGAATIAIICFSSVLVFRYDHAFDFLKMCGLILVILAVAAVIMLAEWILRSWVTDDTSTTPPSNDDSTPPPDGGSELDDETRVDLDAHETDHGPRELTSGSDDSNVGLRIFDPIAVA